MRRDALQRLKRSSVVKGAEAKLEASATGYYFQTYLVVGLAYWLLVVAYTWFQGRLERVLDRPYTR